MSTLSKTFDMAPLPKADAVEVAPPVAEAPSSIISRSNAELDVIITQGMSAMRETFEKAGDWKPSDANRAREVGAQIMKATIDAIKQKQDTAIKQISSSSSKTLQPTESTTNIFTDRNTVLRMIREAGAQSIIGVQTGETDIS